MKPYGQFCPISKASEILGERWTMLIVRELICGGTRFNEIERGIPGIPRAILAQRLKALEHQKIIERREDQTGKPRYNLTLTGHELSPVIMALGEWGQRWLNRDIREEDVDVRLLMWDMHRRIHMDKLPLRKTVVQFDFKGAQAGVYWLLLDQAGTEVCDIYPGFPVDLYVTADALAMHRVWLGRMPLSEALRRGLVELEGPSELVSQFPGWLALSHFAGIRPAQVPRSRVGQPATF
ncbi:MAG: helix-turn-helix transcriptional regulator [Chloroflexi bacterium]|nr:helix-turn-helix transcriptional regulator [Chloroflexota bacterium]